MTRQKKEILKKISEIEEWIAADEEMGCGFAPPDFYNPLYEKIYKLAEQLAKLRHYDSVEDMLYDDREIRAFAGMSTGTDGFPY